MDRAAPFAHDQAGVAEHAGELPHRHEPSFAPNRWYEPSLQTAPEVPYPGRLENGDDGRPVRPQDTVNFSEWLRRIRHELETEDEGDERHAPVPERERGSIGGDEERPR